MASITGGSGSGGTDAAAAGTAALQAPPAPASSEERLVQAVSMAVVGGLICQLLALPLARA